MKTYEQKKVDLVKDIDYLQDEMSRQSRRMMKTGIKDYLTCLRMFGGKLQITKEAWIAVKEMYKIGKIEGKLFDFILANLDHINIEAAQAVVFELDKLNDRTYGYYEDVLDEIDMGIREKNGGRPIRANRGNDSLLTNSTHAKRVVALLENDKSVRNFLCYEDEFWDFMQTYLKVLPTPGYIAKEACKVVPVLDDNRCLVNFYTIVPKVVDMETAVIAIDMYKQAHDLYACLGFKIDEVLRPSSDVKTSEFDAKMEERAARIIK